MKSVPLYNFRRRRLGSMLPILALFICAVCPECVAQPDWVASFGRSERFQDSVYITGFGIARADSSTDEIACTERALSTARRNLTEKVRVSLQNTVVFRQQDINQTISQYFSATTQAVSGLEIEGLESENYQEPVRGFCYALAYVRRDDLARTYSHKIGMLRAKLRELLQAGTKFGSLGDRESALKALTACYPLLRDLERSEGVLFAVKMETSGSVASLEDGSEHDRLTAQSIEEAIGALLTPVTSIDDAAHLAAFLLREQMSQDTVRVRVAPVTYQETRAASSFSRYFQQMLENQLMNVARWKIDAQDGLSSSARADVVNVMGTYWEQSDGLKLLVSMYRGSRYEVVAGVNIIIPQEVMRKSGLSTKPENLQLALADQKEFIRQDLCPVGLNLEVWTNKGSENPVFVRSERMSVYVRLNIPAYVRCVYHLADGRRALLLDNHFLGDKDVNQVYRMPNEFECAAPFGAEVLQVFARTEPFDAVPTKSVDGYDIVTDDLGKFLAITRGMKSVKRPAMQAESRIVLTTVSE